MILIVPDNYEQIVDNVDLCDGYILSIKGFSVNARYKISIDKLKELVSILNNKKIFISINKNIENNEIEDLENILLSLNNINIEGVLYSDPAILTYKNKVKYKLIWHQEHMVTNYETINYWKELGINGAYLSSDITKDEIIEILKKTDVTSFVNLFGYISMFVSKRHIVKNYLEYFNIKDDSKIYYMEKEEKIYPIVDEDLTYAYANNIYNGICEYYNINADYYVCNGFLIDNKSFNKVLKLISSINSKNIKEINDKINSMFDNIDTGFLYKETVSRIK